MGMSEAPPHKTVARIEHALDMLALLLVDDARYEIAYERMEEALQEAKDKAKGKKTSAQQRAAARLSS